MTFELSSHIFNSLSQRWNFEILIDRGLTLVRQLLEAQDLLRVSTDLVAELLDLLHEKLDVLVDQFVGFFALVLSPRRKRQKDTQEGPENPFAEHVII